MFALADWLCLAVPSIFYVTDVIFGFESVLPDQGAVMSVC